MKFTRRHSGLFVPAAPAIIGAHRLPAKYPGERRHMGAIISPYQIGSATLSLPGTPTLDLRPENYSTDTGTWTNTGSAGGTFTQSTASLRAGKTAANSAFNNKPTVDPDGTDDEASSTLTNADVYTNSALTIFVVASTSVTNADTTFSTAAGKPMLTDSGNGYIAFGIASGWRFQNYEGGSDTAADTATVSTTYGIQCQHTGGNITLLRSGGGSLQTTASGNTDSMASTLALFKPPGGSLYFGGSIGIIVGWNSALSAGDLTTAKNNLASFFGFSW